MDNLGLFEPLISNLKRTDVEIFAADLPGHGFSDHVSWPWNYSHSELPKYVFEILERMDYTKYHYVGHSFSGSSITPSLAVSSDHVQSYTILDSHGVLTVRDDTYLKSQRENLEASYKSRRVEKPKEYSREELKKRLQKSSIPPDFQDLWLERGVRWNEDKTRGHFSRDVRLNGNMFIPSFPAFLGRSDHLLEQLDIPILRINGKESLSGHPRPFGGVDPRIRNMKDFDAEGILRFSAEFSNKANVREIVMPGNHHFFLEQAQSVAREIEAFWESVESS